VKDHTYDGPPVKIVIPHSIIRTTCTVSGDDIPKYEHEFEIDLREHAQSIMKWMLAGMVIDAQRVERANYRKLHGLTNGRKARKTSGIAINIE